MLWVKVRILICIHMDNNTLPLTRLELWPPKAKSYVSYAMKVKLLS